MSKNRSIVKLDEVVTPAQRAATPMPGTIYRQIGVRLWGEGAYEREPIDGAQTKYAQLFRAEAGDIIVNKIWARNGSVAVVPTSLAGCYGSGEFPMFRRRGEPTLGDIVFVREGDIGRCAVVDSKHRFCLGQRVMMFRPATEIVDSRFLMYQLISPTVLNDQILGLKAGTTSHHVNIKHLRLVQIKIPSLLDQRRIVAYLDDLQEEMENLKPLQAETSAELDALMSSILDKAFGGEL
jgi:hypothetical protein